MSSITSTLCWCVIQTTLLALLTLALGARPWRLGGTSLPLFGLIGVGVITVFVFVPVPWVWSIPSFVQLRESWKVASNPSIEASSDRTSDVANSFVAGELPPLVEDEKTSAFFAGFADGLLNPTIETESSWSAVQFSNLILGAFLVGMAFGAIRLIYGLVTTRKLIKNSVPVHDSRVAQSLTRLCQQLHVRNDVAVLETESLSTAATVGTWKPIILLPNYWREWDESELNAVLAHELGHISNGDFAAVLISQFSIVVHFYNPLVHWLSRRLRLEQELAADAVAAHVAGGKSVYVRILAKLALEQQDRFVGWPARAFLPTRQTFLRRLEMLRDGQFRSTKRFFAGRWFAMGAVGAACLGLVSLKPPGNPAVAQSPIVKADAKAIGQYDLRYFSDNGGVVIAARPSELLAEKQFAEIAKQLIQDKLSAFGLELTDIEQILVNMDSFKQPSSAYIRAKKPISLPSPLPEGKPATIGKVEVIELNDGLVIWKPDDRSLVVGTKRNVTRFIEGRTADRKLIQTAEWKSLQDRPLVMLVEGNFVRQSFTRGMPMELAVAAPIIQEMELIGMGASIGQDVSLSAFVQSSDAAGAKTIQETGQAAIVLAKNAIKELRLPGDMTQPQRESVMGLVSAVTKMLDGAQWKLEESTVKFTASSKLDDVLTSALSVFASAAKRGSERAESANQLKQIALAFHNFESAYRKLPHPTISINPSDKYPVSWRVKILPFIEQNELYKQYRFDEPWDGPNNSKLLSKMPKIYRHPTSPADSTDTSYVMLSGADTMCPPDKQTSFPDITDGLSNTIMVVEAKTSIPWMKPEDLPYAKDKPLPNVGGYSAEGFHAALGDGSVRFMSTTIKEPNLRALYTAKGGEIIN